LEAISITSGESLSRSLRVMHYSSRSRNIAACSRKGDCLLYPKWEEKYPRATSVSCCRSFGSRALVLLGSGILRML